MSEQKLIQLIIENSLSYETADTFKEQLKNPNNIPVTISKKLEKNGENDTIHYSDTCEILLCEKVTGSILIADKIYPITPETIFVIPPQFVHSARIDKNSGLVYIFKFSAPALEKYINLKHIFSWESDVFDNSPHVLHVFDEALVYVLKMMEPSNTMVENICYILKFFDVLSNAVEPNPNFDNNIYKNEQLKKLIDWTNTNYCKKFTIEEAAAIVNFSKSHFCKFFKQRVGITYIEYVNQLRIQHAIHLLNQGMSTTECCFSCGFESLSYFTRLFKKVTGSTTTKYINTLRKNNT